MSSPTPAPTTHEEGTNTVYVFLFCLALWLIDIVPGLLKYQAKGMDVECCIVYTMIN